MSANPHKPRFQPADFDDALAKGHADDRARFAEAMTKEVARLKDEWLGRVFMRIMPPKVFARSKFNHKKKNRKVIRQWILAHGLQVEDASDRARVRAKVSNEIMAEFRIVEQNGKLVAQERLPENPLPTDQ